MNKIISEPILNSQALINNSFNTSSNYNSTDIARCINEYECYNVTCASSCFKKNITESQINEVFNCILYNMNNDFEEEGKLYWTKICVKKELDKIKQKPDFNFQNLMKKIFNFISRIFNQDDDMAMIYIYI